MHILKNRPSNVTIANPDVSFLGVRPLSPASLAHVRHLLVTTTESRHQQRDKQMMNEPLINRGSALAQQRTIIIEITHW
jgi:hypothetical protein